MMQDMHVDTPVWQTTFPRRMTPLPDEWLSGLLPNLHVKFFDTKVRKLYCFTLIFSRTFVSTTNLFVERIIAVI